MSNDTGQIIMRIFFYFLFFWLLRFFLFSPSSLLISNSLSHKKNSLFLSIYHLSPCCLLKRNSEAKCLKIAEALLNFILCRLSTWPSLNASLYQNPYFNNLNAFTFSFLIFYHLYLQIIMANKIESDCEKSGEWTYN